MKNTKINSNYPTSEEIEFAANVLSRLPAGFQPLPIFEQVARITALSNVEIIPFYKNPADQTIQVILFKRETSDKHWPDLWHTPGAILLCTDKLEPYYNDALQRIVEGEMKNPTIKGQPVCFGERAFDTARGRVISKIFWMEITSYKAGKPFALNNIPEVPENQTELIAEAYKNFKQYNRLP
jgi:hypothetical protein